MPSSRKDSTASNASRLNAKHLNYFGAGNNDRYFCDHSPVPVYSAFVRYCRLCE